MTSIIQSVKVSIEERGNKKNNARAAAKKAEEEKKRTVILEKYADDNINFPRRYDDISRIRYWEHMQDHPYEGELPDNFVSWVSQSAKDDFDLEIETYPKNLRILLYFVTSVYWDYLYLLGFGMFVILTSLYYDEFIIDYFTITKTMLLYPLGVMLASQIVPTLGSVIFVSNYNDLTKSAAKRDFGFWSFNAVLLMQYIEYTYYSGHKRSHLAGKCKIQVKKRVKRNKRKLWARDASVAPKDLEEDDGNEVKMDGTQSGTINLTAGDDGSLATSIEESSMYSGSTMTGNFLSGGGYMKKLQEQQAAAVEEAKRKEKLDREKREEMVRDWLEWQCLVCNKENRRPRHPEDNFVIAFSTKGIFYKRTVAELVKDKDVPKCSFCHTYADYTPRPCSAHIFKYNKNPYVAFENYPESVPSLPRHPLLRLWDQSVSCLFGQRNHPDSKLMKNDWRMSIYLSSRFPVIPRPLKMKEEFFEVGEIVECKIHKVDWTRARILVSRPSRLYDIKFDTGDDLRMVEEAHLRLPPAKGLYAYRTELYLVYFTLLFPLGLAGAMVIQSAAPIFLPLFFIGIILFSYRVSAFLDSFREYYTAGCCVIFQQSAFFTIPTFLLVLSGSIGLAKDYIGMPLVIPAILFICTMFSSLPVMYFKRATFAVMGIPLFTQFSISIFLLALRFDGGTFLPYVSIDVALLLTGVITLVKYRSWLGHIWDVTLFIRPLQYSDYEPSVFYEGYDFIRKLFKKSSDPTSLNHVLNEPTSEAITQDPVPTANDPTSANGDDV